MSWYYSIYGLNVQTDLPVPGLAAAPEQPRVDIAIRTQAVPEALIGPSQSEVDAWNSTGRDASGTPFLRIKELADGRAFRFRYADGCEFVIDRPGQHIWMSWPEHMTLTDALPYLRGPVFGGVLRVRQVVALHASAVSVGGRAVALLWPAGSGQWT